MQVDNAVAGVRDGSVRQRDVLIQVTEPDPKEATRIGGIFGDQGPTAQAGVQPEYESMQPWMRGSRSAPLGCDRIQRLCPVPRLAEQSMPRKVSSDVQHSRQIAHCPGGRQLGREVSFTPPRQGQAFCEAADPNPGSVAPASAGRLLSRTARRTRE